MKTITGIVFVMSGLVCLVLFKRFFVDPAFTPLPNGGFGELYGPVSFFRIPVYGLCILQSLLGCLILAAFWGR
jgi:hypothetical protein